MEFDGRKGRGLDTSDPLEKHGLKKIPGLVNSKCGISIKAAAASFSDSRILCLAVFCGPAVRFPTGVVRLLHYSYCFDVTTLLYIPHTHTHTHTHTPDTSVVSTYSSHNNVVSAVWQLTIYVSPPGQVDNIAERKQWM